MFFTQKTLRQCAGVTSFARGQSYFKDGRVLSFKITFDEVTGIIRGSHKYEATIIYEDGDIIDSWCDCPVGGQCKHVVALGLAAIDRLKNQPNSQIDFPQMAKEGWQKGLSELLQKDSPPAQPAWKLQIMVKVGFLMPKGYNPTRKHTWRLQLKPRLIDLATGVPPTVTNEYNLYTYTGGFYSLFDRSPENLPPKHRLFHDELIAAMRSNFASDYVGNAWTAIEMERLPIVWNILKRHQEYAVELVNNSKETRLVSILTEPIRQILLMEDDATGGLIVRPLLTLNEQEIPVDQVLFLGSPPVLAVNFPDESYSEDGKNESFSLHPLDGIIAPQFNQTITIPKGDVPFFKDEYLPKLWQQQNLRNQSARVKSPLQIRPKVLITIATVGKQKIRLYFQLGYNAAVTTLYNKAAFLRVGSEIVLCQPEQEAILRSALEELLALESNLWDTAKPPHLQEKTTLTGLEAAHFLNHILPHLETMPDTTVLKDPRLPVFTEDTNDPTVEISVVSQDDDQDWFDLNVTVKVSGEPVAFHELFAALATNQTHLILESGRYFSLAHTSFNRLRRLIEESKAIKDDNKDGLSISRFQAGFWHELQALGVVSQQAEEWERAMEGLLHTASIPKIKAPAVFKATLRPYQQEGLNWLYFLYKNGLGGVLADDMGLGKTIQAIALATIVIKQENKATKKPILVVAPTSVVENWDSELAQFAPHLKKIIFRSGDRSESHAALIGADIVVISYALLRHDFDRIKDTRFEMLFLDESQFVKNYQSKMYGLVRRLKCGSRFALSGTPMENNTMELWSVFSIVTPGLFPNPEHFQDMYRRPIEKSQDKDALQRLRTRIRPFMMRRKKELVALDLPPKTVQVLHLELNSQHRHTYDLHLQQERKRILGLLESGGFKQHRMAIFQSLTKLRQLCLHPGLVDKKYLKVPSTKLEVLQERVDTLLSEGHRVLIFSQFTKFLGYVKAQFDEHKLDYLYLDGSTKNRGEIIKDFQEEKKASIFLISLKAGGFGLNLTGADYCILLDPWWNPAAESQAVDRTHRIGQKNPVFVYKLIAQGTIEEKVLQLQEKKKRLFENVVEEGDLFGSAVTEDDIRAIFA